jgi:hypothetical protein
MLAHRITPTYLERVERLAKGTKDPALADYYRRTVRLDSILSALNDIRGLLRAGQIIEADIALETLRTNWMVVEHRFTQPFFQTGAKQLPHLDSGRTQFNAKRKRVADRKHRRWIAEARNAWKHNRRLTVSACAGYVIKKLKLKAAQKTVEDVIRRFHPKKVGDAG